MDLFVTKVMFECGLVVKSSLVLLMKKPFFRRLAASSLRDDDRELDYDSTGTLKGLRKKH